MTRLPEPVRDLVEQRVSRLPHAALVEASAALSAHYREGRPTSSLALPPEEKLAAYLATRLPATFAVASRVLDEVRRRLAGIRATSLLDLGAGVGAAALAASEKFPALAEMTLLEPDPILSGAGRQLAPAARWIESDFDPAQPLQTHDLVIASYAIGEMPSPLSAVERAWQAARVAFVLIEPGSTRGFALVRAARARLILRGGQVLAPCPGNGACPIISPDWCHFGQRVERSSLHRRLKRGALGYEDEKYSYVAVAHAFAGRAAGRLLRRPAPHPGWIELTVCQDQGICTERISRKQGAAYRAARKAGWGDAWPPELDREIRVSDPQTPPPQAD